MNKYTLALVALQLGLDVMVMDFDTFLMRNPTARIYEQAEHRKSDLLMGYSFVADCICNAFFFLRARPVVVTWVREVLHWMYDHPYENDQRCMSAFLNYTERVHTNLTLPDIPRWDVFDVNNEFMHYEGWLGDPEKIYIIHFVEGSSAELMQRGAWDASIPPRRLDPNSGGELKVQASGAHELMDLFYGVEAAEAWRDPAIAHALEVTRETPPLPPRMPCGILQEAATSHSGFGWVSQALAAEAEAADVNG